MNAETPPSWPDSLQAPNAARVADLLPAFWRTLDALPALLNDGELLLAEELTARLRGLVIEMMLAVNGISRPAATQHLNLYLGKSQRAVFERTLVARTPQGDSWLARAVALTVIQSWYAPQLVARFRVEPPAELEAAVCARLAAALPGWPLVIAGDELAPAPPTGSSL